jgi:hypothetical protein
MEALIAVAVMAKYSLRRKDGHFGRVRRRDVLAVVDDLRSQQPPPKLARYAVIQEIGYG